MKKIFAALFIVLIISTSLGENVVAEASYSVKWISEEYEWVYTFNEGMARVTKRIDGKIKYGFIDMSGKETVPSIYDSASYFYEGLAAVCKDGKYGFVDKKGKVVVPLIYDATFNFCGGLAKVKKNEKYGYINKSGKVVVPIVYDYAEDFVNGFARVAKGTGFPRYGIVNSKGKEIVPTRYDYTYEFHEGLAVVQNNRKCGVVDTNGKFIIPLKYALIGNFSNGVTFASNGDKCGVIDKTGKVIVPFKYENVDNFFDGLAGVIISMKDGKYGHINAQGKLISNYWGHQFFEGYAEVRKSDNEVGFINTSGKVIVPLKYEASATSGYHNGFFIVAKNFGPEQKYGYLNKVGKEVTGTIYDLANGFNDGLAVVGRYSPEYREIKLGYIDKTGKEVIPLEFDRAYDFSSGAATVYKNNKWGFIVAPTSDKVK